MTKTQNVNRLLSPIDVDRLREDFENSGTLRHFAIDDFLQPSFFATVPKLIERMGRSERGSVTGMITVLLDADDPNEPVADTLRGLLDGHLFLSRDLAHRGHFPAVDVLASLSRLMPMVATPEHRASAQALREALAHYKEGRDLVEIGAYKPGTNPALDRALTLLPALESFLRQGLEESSSFDETVAALHAALGGGAG